jgi:hypothetical protein
MLIFNRRDFLTWAKRLSAFALFTKTSAFASSPQIAKPPSIPTSPPVVGPGTNDANWELTRQAQQRMSDYIQQTLIQYEQSRNNYPISHGAELKAGPSNPESFPQLLWNDDEGPEGATHEDFPREPKFLDPRNGRFYDEEGNEFNPEIDINFD